MDIGIDRAAGLVNRRLSRRQLLAMSAAAARGLDCELALSTLRSRLKSAAVVRPEPFKSASQMFP